MSTSTKSSSASRGAAVVAAIEAVPALEISDELLARMNDDLACRRIGAGLEWLRAHATRFGSLDAAQPGTARFLWCLAQWVDMGFARPSLVKDLLARFTPAVRARLPLQEYL